MKVHIIFNFVDSAWGGGNQFLKALKAYLILNNMYSETPKDSDVFLFNSHHELSTVLKLKLRYPNKFFIHRVDGPINIVRGNSIKIDEKIFNINQQIADGTIFQSNWSKNTCLSQGMNLPLIYEIIHNAPNPEIFFKSSVPNFSINNKKIRIIAASWSSNAKKGFEIYKYLDEHLDFEKFEMTYVGNTPVSFKNIKHIPPISSIDLAHQFRLNDVFISASHLEACSNAIVEAMNCGLIPIVRNNSSQPELVKNSDLVFNDHQDILKILSNISSNITYYHNALQPPTMNVIGNQYINFFKKVISNEYQHTFPKHIGIFNALILFWRTKF